VKQPLSLEVAAVLLTLHPNRLDPMRQPRQVLTESGEIQLSQITVKHSVWTESRRTVDGEKISTNHVSPEIFVQLHTDLSRYAKRPKHITRLTAYPVQQHANAAD
jgi:hypothetical protein